MKKIKAALIAAIAALAIGTQAQTNTASTNTAPTILGTIETAASWIGNINTNYSFGNVLTWDGPIYENQVNIANELGGSVDLWHSVKNPGTNSTLFLGLESRDRQAGIAGSWLSEGIGAEFGYQKCDVRLGIFLDGVYLNNPKAVSTTVHKTFELGAFADKMLSPTLATGLFMSYQEHQKYPIFGVRLTVTFGGGNGLFGL